MNNETPFTLHIFVADGDPDGLRLVERSNWIGKAVIFPRALYPQVRSRAEFQQIGVYLRVAKYKSGGDGSLKQTAAMWPPRVTVKRGCG
jgi:hypothetical protein